MDPIVNQPQMSFDETPDIIQYPNQAVIRIVERTPQISESCAKLCLIEYGWDEVGLAAGYGISPEYVLHRSGYMGDGERNLELSTCTVCWSHTMCLDGGCGHKMCTNCFRDYCSSRVRGGDLRVHCPYYKCGKFFSFGIVEFVLDENLTFELGLAILNHYVVSRPDVTWCARRLCCCLITHRNWPLSRDFPCSKCNMNMVIKQNGEARGFDPTTFAFYMSH